MGLSRGFAAAAAPVPGPSEGPPILLIVDDEIQVTAAIADQLRRQCRVVTASRGEEALRLLESHDVSVIVSDQRMPEMSGSEFLKRASERYPDASRVLLTGYSDLEAVIKAVNEGRIFFYLAKPWTAADLEMVVTKAVEHNRLLRERRGLIDDLREANADLEVRVAERTHDLQEANGRIAELARTDALTGLQNRRAFDESLAREAGRSQREQKPLVALLLDVDHFKTVNDDFGHPVGDAVLAGIGAVLAKSLRPYDVAARYGGEEFVALLPGASMVDGRAVAERIRAAIAAMRVDVCPRPVTASLGVASLARGELPEQLVARADAALYRAKRSGRNRVEGAVDDVEDP